ncbi:MAG: radical SAM protein [Planctomycetota bacterium]
MRLTLVLTHQCDLACRYCYAGEKRAKTLPWTIGVQAIDRALAELEPEGTLSLGLFGGEPLLAWPLGRALVDYARERAGAWGQRIALHVTTNGSRLDARVLDELLEREAQLALSVDGLPEVHDAWRPRRGGGPSSASALAALDLLVARGVDARVITVVRPETVEHLAAGVRFLHARGARRFVPSLDYGAPWRPEDAPALTQAIAELRELWVERYPALEIGWLETKAVLLARPDLQAVTCCEDHSAVAPSGRRYPCERLVGDDRGALPTCSGGRGELPEACQRCPIRRLCSSRSACVNLARTGRADRPDGLVCLLEKTLVREAARAVQELAVHA